MDTFFEPVKVWHLIVVVGMLAYCLHGLEAKIGTIARYLGRQEERRQKVFEDNL